MRLLRRSLMIAVLAAGLGPAAPAQDVSYMPVDQIRPGMKGWGLTVLKGTEPVRFEFEVVDLQDYWRGIPKVIEIRFWGGPKDSRGKEVLAQTHVISGMSGSPLYVGGKLIGALSMAPEYQTTSKGFATPAEYMLGMRRGDVPRPGQETIKPGEYFKTCLVWGDADDCISATATFKDGGLIFATGHQLESFAVGPMELPVWRVGVADTLEIQSSSVKLYTRAIGGVIGTLSYNGLFGSIITPGNAPTQYEVKVGVELGGGVPAKVRTYEAAYQFQSAALIKDHIAELVTSSIDPKKIPSSVMEATIWLEGAEQPIRLVDHPQRGLTSLDNILEAVINQIHHRGTAPIRSVNVRVTMDPRGELCILRYMGFRDGVDDVQYVLMARATRDNRFMRTFLPFKSVEGANSSKLAWLDGGQVQDRLLREYNISDVLPQLRAIEERRDLYLVDPRDFGPASRADGDVPTGWVPVKPAFSILQRMDAGIPLVLEDAQAFLMDVEHEPKTGKVTLSVQRGSLDELIK